MAAENADDDTTLACGRVFRFCRYRYVFRLTDILPADLVLATVLFC